MSLFNNAIVLSNSSNHSPFVMSSKVASSLANNPILLAEPSGEQANWSGIFSKLEIPKANQKAVRRQVRDNNSISQEESVQMDNNPAFAIDKAKNKGLHLGEGFYMLVVDKGGAYGRVIVVNTKAVSKLLEGSKGDKIKNDKQ